MYITHSRLLFQTPRDYKLTYNSALDEREYS